MAYVFAEGGYGAAATVIHTDPSHPDVISISDAELLRDGTLHRVGTDLHLKGHAGQHVVISGYGIGHGKSVARCHVTKAPRYEKGIKK